MVLEFHLFTSITIEVIIMSQEKHTHTHQHSNTQQVENVEMLYSNSAYLTIAGTNLASQPERNIVTFRIKNNTNGTETCWIDSCEVVCLFARLGLR